MDNLDKFLEVIETFKTIHPTMELPQMIYSTIIANNLKNADIFKMDTEEWIECMTNAILHERDEPTNTQFEKEFLKTEENEQRNFDEQI